MALEVCENTLKQNMMNYNLTTTLSPRHTRVLRIPVGTDSTSVSAGSAGSNIDPANLDQPPLDHNTANPSGPETPPKSPKEDTKTHATSDSKTYEPTSGCDRPRQQTAYHVTTTARKIPRESKTIPRNIYK